MTTTHKVLAIINFFLFFGGYRIASRLGSMLGLLSNTFTISLLVIIILTPVIWGTVLSIRYLRSKPNPDSPKKGMDKFLAFIPFLNVAILVAFLLFVIFFN